MLLAIWGCSMCASALCRSRLRRLLRRGFSLSEQVAPMERCSLPLASRGFVAALSVTPVRSAR